MHGKAVMGCKCGSSEIAGRSRYKRQAGMVPAVRNKGLEGDMIHLTREEKASRYDSLQVAIKHTIESYKRRRADADRRYRDADVLGAYNKGLSDGFGYILDDLERWSE